MGLDHNMFNDTKMIQFWNINTKIDLPFHPQSNPKVQEESGADCSHPCQAHCGRGWGSFLQCLWERIIDNDNKFVSEAIIFTLDQQSSLIEMPGQFEQDDIGFASYILWWVEGGCKPWNDSRLNVAMVERLRVPWTKIRLFD